MIALKQRKLELYDAVMAGAVRGSGQGVLTEKLLRVFALAECVMRICTHHFDRE